MARSGRWSGTACPAKCSRSTFVGPGYGATAYRTSSHRTVIGRCAQSTSLERSGLFVTSQDGAMESRGAVDDGDALLLEEFLAECSAICARVRSWAIADACRLDPAVASPARTPMIAAGCRGAWPVSSHMTSGLRKRLSYIYPVEAFARFLAARGVVPSAVSTTRKRPSVRIWKHSAQWLRRHRGIREGDKFQTSQAVRVDAGNSNADPVRYKRGMLQGRAVAPLRNEPPEPARILATSMRMYLRFLAARGSCSPALVGIVPSPPPAGGMLRVAPRTRRRYRARVGRGCRCSPTPSSTHEGLDPSAARGKHQRAVGWPRRRATSRADQPDPSCQPVQWTRS